MPSGRFTSHLLRRLVGVVLILAVGFAAGYTVAYVTSTGEGPGQEQASSGQKWYCSMHPHIVKDGPGMCPICEMPLIPMPAGMAAGGAERQLVVTEAAAKLMDIETAPVQRKEVTAEIRMVGKIAYDETRVKHITAWVGGRLDRLFVDFTGITVRRGDHLVELYSPELISAQAELLQAVKGLDGVGPDGPTFVKTSAQKTLEAAREKLRLLGLRSEQISQIEQSGEVLEHVTIYSPIGGIVIEKRASEGMYVATGTHVYTVADLSEVWVKLDAYESDLAWIRYGQDVEFTTEAYPGEVFKGKISFEDPTLDPRTRTVKVRVNVANEQGKLKPEMFVRAVVKSKIAQAGKIMDADLSGKWICPMHPSVIRDAPSPCPICEMDLVTTESLGYVTTDMHAEVPLVIPSSAPLITGERAVVYVQVPDANEPTFEGREVVLGPRAGDHYIIRSGLAEGERVVTRGNFKIDSALQLQAKPSMMNPQVDAEARGGPQSQGHSHTH